MALYREEPSLSTNDMLELDLAGEALQAFLRQADHPSAAVYAENNEEYTLELARGIHRIRYRGTCGPAQFTAEISTDSDAVRYLEDQDAVTLH